MELEYFIQQQKNYAVGILLDTGMFNLVYLSNINNQFYDKTVYQYTALIDLYFHHTHDTWIAATTFL